jgi:hypothetical protein
MTLGVSEKFPTVAAMLLALLNEANKKLVPERKAATENGEG